MSPKTDYLITGATGLVGSHILFELLHATLSKKETSHIYLLVRAKNEEDGLERIKQIISSPKAPTYLTTYSFDELLECITIIPDELNSESLKEKMQRLPLAQITVIHAAASTNLMHGSQAEQDVICNNREGTLNLLSATEGCKKFVFISTAFSCGIQEEEIFDDYSHYHSPTFRNAYEENKLFIERYIQEIMKESSTTFQILRPSVVSGRLFDTPKYAVSKFDVFYGWTKFFWKYRDEINEQGIRVWINKQGTMNIIPVDYVAKTVLQAIEKPSLFSLNIVHSNPPAHPDYMREIFKTVGVKNFQFVSEQPTDLNRAEKIFYNSVAPIVNPYGVTPGPQYNTTQLKEIIALEQPDITAHMKDLIEFAIANQFEEGY